jgi:hypothetical protein
MDLILKLLSTLALIVIAACAVYFISYCCMPSVAPGAAARQLIAGYSQTATNMTVYSSTPIASSTENQVQMRMSPGTVSKLRVTMRTIGTLTGSGQLTATVRINGANTTVTCQMSAAGDCDSGTASVAVADDDRLTVMISNNFSGSPTIVVQWTLLYN